MRRAHPLKKTLILGKIEGKRRKGWQRIRWLDSVTNFSGHESEQTPRDRNDRKAFHAAVHGVAGSDMTE